MKSLMKDVEKRKILGEAALENIASGMGIHNAEFQDPLCGLISLKPMEIIRDEIKHLERPLKENEVKWEQPTLNIGVLGK
jgi:adenine deaminase